MNEKYDHPAPLETLVTALESVAKDIEAAGEIAEKQQIVHDTLMNMLQKAFKDGFEQGLKTGYAKGYMDGKGGEPIQ